MQTSTTWALSRPVMMSSAIDSSVTTTSATKPHHRHHHQQQQQHQHIRTKDENGYILSSNRTTIIYLHFFSKLISTNISFVVRNKILNCMPFHEKNATACRLKFIKFVYGQGPAHRIPSTWFTTFLNAMLRDQQPTVTNQTPQVFEC